MAVVINGDTGISPVTASGTSASVDGMTVGRGGGEVSTNTAVGTSVLQANTSGAYNTILGYQAGYSNTTGSTNVAIGRTSFYNNTTGSDNTAVGHESGFSNTTGASNTALGQQALRSNTTASYNTAVGYQSGYSNLLGSANTFLGYQAGYSFAASSATSTYNTFLGYSAGYLATTGTNNTFVGNGAGQSVTTGGKNTILGNYGGNQSFLDMRTLSNYVVLSDGDGNARQIINNSGQLLFGTTGATNAYYNRINIWEATSAQTGIYMQKYNQVEVQIGFKSGTNTDFYIGTGSTAMGTYGVYLANSGTSWVSVSDERQKDIIEPIENALTKINTFRTVIGKYKHDTNNVRRPFLIAQDVQAVFPEAVKVQEDEEALLGLAYTDVIPLLVAAIKELKAEFDAYKATHP